jgi:hypothetical protein
MPIVVLDVPDYLLEAALLPVNYEASRLPCPYGTLGTHHLCPALLVDATEHVLEVDQVDFPSLPQV